MKKIVLYLTILIIFSCASDNESHDLKGYYFNKKNSEIFWFKNNLLIKYNVVDSSSTKIPISKVKNNTIKLGVNTYNYKKIKNNSIVIYNFDNNNINLTRFNFNEIDINKLNNTDWSLKVKNKEDEFVDQFIKIDGKKGFYFFAYDKTLKDTTLFHFVPFRGKYFNKFNTYFSTSTIVMGGFENNKLSLLITDNFNGNKTEEYTLKKMFPKRLNSLLIGKWNQLAVKNKKRDISYYTYAEYIIDSTLSVKEKYKSIKSKYLRIEFTENTIKLNDVDNQKYKINNLPSSKYIFINNSNIDFQYFEILKLSKDTLYIKVIEDSMPDLYFTFIKSPLPLVL